MNYNYYYGFPSPGSQVSDSNHVFEHLFFEGRSDWKEVREYCEWDYVVIGSGFCGLAFVERIQKKQPGARVLMLERGGHFLPEHFQNLPPAYKAALPNQIFHTETYPWSLSATAVQNTPGATWQHGMVPFFGGRSTLWSAWCPRPQAKDLHDWPKEVTDMMTDEFFRDAEHLLNVVPASKLDEGVPDDKRIYHHAQRVFGQRLSDAVAGGRIPSAFRTEGAPLAVADSDNSRSAFTKFSVNSKLLALLQLDKDEAVKRQAKDAKETGTCKPLLYYRRFVIKTDCTVNTILFQGELATALNTSQGTVVLARARGDGTLHSTELVLAVGCMPAATLLLNSLPMTPNVPVPGSHFGAHFISAITARIPGKYLPEDLGYGSWNPLEIGALYLGGSHPDSKLTWHAQISILSFKELNDLSISTAQRFMPDVVSTASPEQIQSSPGCVLFVYAILGEMDLHNPDNYLKITDETKKNDVTANAELSWRISERDRHCWELMEADSYASLKSLVGESNAKYLEYWDFSANSWTSKAQALKVPGMVHESSVLQMGPDKTQHPVDLNFRVRRTKNVFATGSGLWPTATSINPTMTMCGFAQKLADQRAAEKAPVHEPVEKRHRAK